MANDALVPVDWSTARGFVQDWHRHNRRPVGYVNGALVPNSGVQWNFLLIGVR